MLRLVTFTGADHTVTDPHEMAVLSARFPFIEWGILIGSDTFNMGRLGKSRFPCITWIDWLCDVKASNPGMRLSLHICGEPLREVLAGDPRLIRRMGELLQRFERCQLNFHGEPLEQSGPQMILHSFLTLKRLWRPEIIFQLDGANDQAYRDCADWTPIDNERPLQVAGLFDRSHGAGVSPGEWPKPLADIPCGYAGGIGPDNIVAELGRLRKVWGHQPGIARVMPIWCDMETKLFDSANRFSLELCNDVASKVSAEEKLFPGLILSPM